LITEASITLEAIHSLANAGESDPFTDPGTLIRAITQGVLDAPHLLNNPFARGSVRTRLISGACQAVGENGQAISEAERLALIGLT
jgi:hypothetical protein